MTGADRRRLRVEQQGPHALAGRRAAGLAREHDLVAARAQGVGQEAGLGALAGPVDALQRHEAPAAQGAA